MSIDYKKSTPHCINGRDINRYDGKIGLFFIGAQDNGEGWWNWWVALAEQGPAAGDRAIYDAGGAMSWPAARRLIEQVVRDTATALLKKLDEK